ARACAGHWTSSPPGGRSTRRLGLRLTAPRALPPRLRPLPWRGTTPRPSPAPPDVSPHTARGLGGMAVLRPRLPSVPCSSPCAASLTVAASCMPERVCTRLTAAPPALQELLYQSLQALIASLTALIAFESVPSSRAGSPSPATRPVRASSSSHRLFNSSHRV